MDEKNKKKEEELNSTKENNEEVNDEINNEFDRIDALKKEMDTDEKDEADSTDYSIKEEKNTTSKEEEYSSLDDIFELEEEPPKKSKKEEEDEELESVKIGPLGEDKSTKSEETTKEENETKGEEFFSTSADEFFSETEEEKESETTEEKTTTVERKRSRIGLYLLGAVTFLVLFSFIYFMIYPERWVAMKQQVGYAQTEDNTFSSTLDEYDEPDNTATTDDNTATADDKEEVTSLPDEDAELTDTEKQQQQSVVGKWGLEVPAIIISYASLSTEDKARAAKKKLTDKGLSAGYYWMPDYTPGSKAELFKVYVGPFKDWDEAEKALDGVKKLNKDAYVMKVEMF